MYAISFALVVVALITLVVGVFQSGLTFIWASIASSVLAAIFLALGVLQKKPVQPATAGAPYGEAAGAMPATAVPEAAPMTAEAPAVPAAATATLPAEAMPEEEEPEPAVAPARASRASSRPKAAPRSTAAKASAKRAPAKAAATSTGSMVVAIPERGTYHKSTCRFVKGRRDTERITRTTADRRGYSACGICRP